MKKKEEIEAIVNEIAKKEGYTFPEYDNFGNVKVTTDGMVVIMRADAFHEAMKKGDGVIRSFLKRLDMIKLKQEVNKSEIMRELKAEAEIAFENT